MANWTLLQATDKVKFFVRSVNQKFYQDDDGTDQPIIDFLNEGIADMTAVKAPYMLWDNHDVPCASTKILMLDEDMLSVKRVESMDSETDNYPVELLQPEDLTIHETYLEFTEPYTGIIRILATRKPALLEGDNDPMPFGSPFQLGVVYYAAATITLSGGNAGVQLSGQYMGYYERIKSMWEHQTMNEHTYLRGQDNNPINSGRVNAVDPQGKIDVWG
jgi:hypothetical protein